MAVHISSQGRDYFLMNATLAIVLAHLLKGRTSSLKVWHSNLKQSKTWIEIGFTKYGPHIYLMSKSWVQIVMKRLLIQIAIRKLCETGSPTSVEIAHDTISSHTIG